MPEASQLIITYLDPVIFSPTNNLAMPAAEYARVGGLDPAWAIAGGEDRDLCARWRKAGLKLLRCEAAVVAHHHELNLRAFWRQHFEYGRGAYQFRQRHLQEQRSSPRFYFDLIRFPFGRYPAPRAFTLAHLLALSQLATAAGYLRQACS